MHPPSELNKSAISQTREINLKKVVDKKGEQNQKQIVLMKGQKVTKKEANGFKSGENK